MQFTLTGAHIQVYVNNQVLKEVQSISFDIDYGEQQLRGIDSPYPQEIAVTSISVTGSMQLIRQKNSGGIQSQNMRPLFTDVAAGPYINIRVHDRQSGEDILFLPSAKIIKESHSAATKAIYRVNISFTGIIPLAPADRVDQG